MILGKESYKIWNLHQSTVVSMSLDCLLVCTYIGIFFLEFLHTYILWKHFRFCFLNSIQIETDLMMTVWSK